MENHKIPDELWDLKNAILARMNGLIGNDEYEDYKQRFVDFGEVCAQYGPKIVALAKQYEQPFSGSGDADSPPAGASLDAPEPVLLKDLAVGDKFRFLEASADEWYCIESVADGVMRCKTSLSPDEAVMHLGHILTTKVILIAPADKVD